MLKEQNVQISLEGHRFKGILTLPLGTHKLVLFVHGSGSSRTSPRNQFVARSLNEAGIGTLLFDLLTPDEERVDMISGEYRFNISFLGARLITVTEWVLKNPMMKSLSLGYLGASTGAAAALIVAASSTNIIKAVVSRGGRPDLAAPYLKKVRAATLLIIGGNDHPVIEMNEEAFQKLSCIKDLIIIPGATHLFEEKGKLEEVSQIAQQWFNKYLTCCIIQFLSFYFQLTT